MTPICINDIKFCKLCAVGEKTMAFLIQPRAFETKQLHITVAKTFNKGNYNSSKYEITQVIDLLQPVNIEALLDTIKNDLEAKITKWDQESDQEWTR